MFLNFAAMKQQLYRNTAQSKEFTPLKVCTVDNYHVQTTTYKSQQDNIYVQDDHEATSLHWNTIPLSIQQVIYKSSL